MYQAIKKNAVKIVLGIFLLYFITNVIVNWNEMKESFQQGFKDGRTEKK
ncbi:MAG: hypothetical protein RLZZ312_1343 [Bacteroidota bacterium]|jgi:hypothetical protein